MSLFVHGAFKSHSGIILKDKIECNALTPADWEAIARWFADRISFYTVYGVPEGGLPLERALRPLCDHRSRFALIVDDVLTTGNSMNEMRTRIGGFTKGAVLFARTKKVPDWITPRFIEQP